MQAGFDLGYAVSTDAEYEESLDILKQGVPPQAMVERVGPTKTQSQPKWDLQNPPDLHDLLHNRLGKNSEPVFIDAPDIFRETWACYRPFHTSREKGGIVLWASGVAACASRLQQAVGQVGGVLSDRAAVVWAMSLLHWHELVHHIVEDLVSALEFTTEDRSIFNEAQVRWSGFVAMEEAIANSFAYSVQHEYLAHRTVLPNLSYERYEEGRRRQAQIDNASYVPETEPVVDRGVMLQALTNVLRGQPVGYCNFVDFGQRWTRLLVANLQTLIYLLYLKERHPHDLHVLSNVLFIFEKWHPGPVWPWVLGATVQWADWREMANSGLQQTVPRALTETER
jgi:hypothetical protein